MKITDKLILRCMRHTFIWAWDASIMYAAYHLQHFLPPILFTLIMAVGGMYLRILPCMPRISSCMYSLRR